MFNKLEIPVKTAVTSALLAAFVMMSGAVFPFYLIITPPIAAGILAALTSMCGVFAGLCAGILGMVLTGAALYFSMTGAGIGAILLSTAQISLFSVLCGIVVGILLRHKEKFKTIVSTGASVWLGLTAASFIAYVLLTGGTLSLQSIAYSVEEFTKELVNLVSVITQQTAPEMRPYLEAAVKRGLQVLPGMIVFMSLALSFFTLCVAKFWLRRICRRDILFLAPVEFFKVSKTGGLLYFLAYLAALFIKNRFILTVLSNNVSRELLRDAYRNRNRRFDSAGPRPGADDGTCRLRRRDRRHI